MENQRFQIYLAGTYSTEWTTLKRELRLPDERVIKTKLLANGHLQYVRRTGLVGVATEMYRGGPPVPGQWRVHPADAAPKPVFAHSKPAKPAEPVIPPGVEFE